MLTQQTQNIRTTFIQRRTNGFDVGPPLCKCYTNVIVFAGRAVRVSIDCMAHIHWVTVDCVNTSYTVKITGSLNVVLRLASVVDGWPTIQKDRVCYFCWGQTIV